MIWILGEYCDRIDSVDDLLGSFLENFQEENVQVQLQLLTAIVKLFLKRPADTQELVQNVLSLATQDSDNPDLRDRGYIYWRLLSTDPAAAKVSYTHAVSRPAPQLLSLVVHIVLWWMKLANCMRCEPLPSLSLSGCCAGREANHFRGDRPPRASAAGRAHLSHLYPCLRLPQASLSLC